MKRVLLILVVLFTSLLGGYLRPFPGITLFFLLIVLLFLKVGADIKIGKDEILALLFACCGVASTLYASDKWGAILFSGSFMAGSIFYVVLRNSSDWESILLKTVVIGGCIVCLADALYQLNLLPQRPFYNPNPLSGFLTPLVPISFYRYLQSRKKAYAAASALLVFANFLSASRTGVATMIIAMVAMVLFFYREKDKHAVKALFLVIVVGFCSFLLFSHVKDAFALKGVEGMLEKPATGITQRVYLLKTTFQVIRQTPLLGHGLNSFHSVMMTLSNPYVVDPAIHAHSVYLNILAELGIVGLALFLCFVVLVMKGPLTSSFLLKVALSAFLFHNIVEYNFPPPPFQVLFYLLCAAIMGQKPNNTKPLHIRRGTVRIIAILLSFYFIVLHLFPTVALIPLRRANAAVREGNVQKTVNYLLLSTYFGYSVSALHADTARLLTQVYFSSGMKDNNLLKIAERNYLKALSLNSLDGPLYVDIADFYALTRRYDKAQSYLSEVISKYPYHQEYRVALARLYAAQGRDSEAIGILEASNTLLKKYAPLLPLRVNVLAGLAQLYRRQGDAVRSEDWIAKARRLKEILEERPSPDKPKKDSNPLPAR